MAAVPPASLSGLHSNISWKTTRPNSLTGTTDTVRRWVPSSASALPPSVLAPPPSSSSLRRHHGLPPLSLPIAATSSPALSMATSSQPSVETLQAMIDKLSRENSTLRRQVRTLTSPPGSEAGSLDLSYTSLLTAHNSYKAQVGSLEIALLKADAEKRKLSVEVVDLRRELEGIKLELNKQSSKTSSIVFYNNHGTIFAGNSGSSSSTNPAVSSAAMSSLDLPSMSSRGMTYPSTPAGTMRPAPARQSDPSHRISLPPAASSRRPSGARLPLQASSYRSAASGRTSPPLYVRSPSTSLSGNSRSRDFDNLSESLTDDEEIGAVAPPPSARSTKSK